MRSHRHLNPTVDIRKPRRGERVSLNPPGFVVKPMAGVERYAIELSADRNFGTDQTIRGEFGPWTVFVPDEPLAAGRWYWRWFAGERCSEVWRFDVTGDALAQKVPKRDELAGLVGAHPRLLFTPERLQSLRSGSDALISDELERLERLAVACMEQPHEMAEPPWLPARGKDQQVHLRLWRTALTDSRAFASGAAALALAWLIWQDGRYAQAAIARLTSLARWDPDGSTSIQHNDEPHMSVIQHGPLAYDWLYEAMSESQRQVIADHLGRRLANTYRHLRYERNHGIEQIGSHAGRMLGFLGMGGLALLDESDEAGQWLDYVLRLMVAAWPEWGGQDGGWAQGIAYSSFYVTRACEFAYALYTAIGFNLYAKGFFANHLKWRLLCVPTYAEQTAFGDAAERSPRQIPDHYVCLEHLRRMFGLEQIAPLIQSQCRRVIQDHRDYFSPLTLVTDPPAGLRGERRLARAAAFKDVGWVAFRRDLESADDDIALLTKSSPYGSISHSHGDQNAFVLHAFGKTLAIASGYYDAYGTLHHHCWTRQTKAVNAVTLAGVGQRVGDESAVGQIAAFRAARRYAYSCGRAGGAYAGRLERADRHIVFADSRYFVVVDDLRSSVADSFWWHLHSYDRMEFDQEHKTVVISRDGVRLLVQLVYLDQMVFQQHDVFDVQPLSRDGSDCPAQWHFAAIPVPMRRSEVLAAILIPLKPGEPAPTVEVLPSDGCACAVVSWGADAWGGELAGRQDVWLFARPDSRLLAWEDVRCEGLFGWFEKTKQVGLWQARA